MSTLTGRIVLLSLGRKSRILSVDTEGSDLQTLVTDLVSFPDGVAIDPINRHLYYTFMGATRDGEDYFENEGYIERCNYDGSERKVVVPAGTFVTGKQIQFDVPTQRMYWCDREGMRLMSCRPDGSDVTVHMQTGSGEDREDRRRHFVGVAVDPIGGYLYFTLKGKPNGNEGRILRLPLNDPGMDPRNRADAELLFGDLPEPIDLEWDGETQTLYWTDRGDPPKGNTLNRAKIRDGKAVDHEILLSNLEEAIGLALDHKGRRVFVSDLKGQLRVMSLDRPGRSKVIFKSQGPLTGIAYLSA